MIFFKKWLSRSRVRQRRQLSRLLLGTRELERAIRKERLRCDRYRLAFGLIRLQLYSQGVNYDREVKALAKILHHRLRLTDERGMMRYGRIGILLPHTDRAGTQLVLDQIGALAAQKEIYFKAEILVYPHEEDHLDGGKPGEEKELVSATNAAKQEEGVHAEALDWRDSLSEMRTGRYPAWKRTIDILGATVGLAIGAPLLAAAAIAIKVDSPGPVFFRQKRTGHLGRVFSIWKLRTMVVGADGQKAALMESNERDGPAFKMARDPRVTKIGGILRKIGLDELPQLWNVLIGDMALVGPRPLPCHEDAQCLPWQRRRLDTRPGITCTWQIAKSREVTFDEWMRMDLSYSDNKSLSKDVGLLFRTVFAVLRGRVEH